MKELGIARSTLSELVGRAGTRVLKIGRTRGGFREIATAAESSVARMRERFA